MLQVEFEGDDTAWDVCLLIGVGKGWLRRRRRRYKEVIEKLKIGC